VKLLDSFVNRLLACEKAGVEPRYETFDGDDAGALALVISLNVQRRELTPGQRAIVAARRWGLDGHSKGGRPPKGGKPMETPVVSIRQLVKQFKVTENPRAPGKRSGVYLGRAPRGRFGSRPDRAARLAPDRWFSRAGSSAPAAPGRGRESPPNHPPDQTGHATDGPPAFA
jgi:hypothetical protein